MKKPKNPSVWLAGGTEETQVRIAGGTEGTQETFGLIGWRN
jgi:hypothetical protein